MPFAKQKGKCSVTIEHESGSSDLTVFLIDLCYAFGFGVGARIKAKGKQLSKLIAL